jgi:NitT/TauT family transport system ATP-binding protein
VSPLGIEIIGSELLPKLELKSTIIFVTHDIPEAVFLGDDIHIMSSNPGRIVKYIHVDLPLERTREIKKTTEFINYVSDIEAELMEY